MARTYSVSTRSTTAGTAARPVGSLFAVANRTGFLREVAVFNTTATACAFRLARCTAAGTPGAGLTEVQHHTSDEAPDLTGFADHTADATISAGSFRQFALGASIGSGVVWTFESPGIFIPAGTANGIGIVPVGTGQFVDWSMEWSE